MPFCPTCRLEYRPTFTECADCGAELVDALPPKSPPAPAASVTDVVVARVHGQPLAEMWAELLGNQGIPSRMSPVSGVADTVYPTDTVYELLVPAIDAPRARGILPPAPETNRIPRARRVATDEKLLDEVDQALAEGDLDLANDLLDSVEDSPGA